MSNEKELLKKDSSSYFDTDLEEMSLEKKALLRRLRKNVVDQETIENLAKELKVDILGLDTKINNILTKHHNDYLSTFDEFMDTVRKDLKHKIEQMEKVEREKRKNNDIRIITSERDFFRQEAIRLNELCKELSGKVDEMTRELKFQTSELVNISKKWKESENTNKQLIVELERNIQINKDLEFQLKISTESIQMKSSYQNPKIEDKPKIDEENFQEFNKEKLFIIIDKLKSEVKKETIRNHKILAEFNKIVLDKNKLEVIFVDCVEECRRDIFNRKLKESINIKKHSSSYYNKMGMTMPLLNNVKYDNFLSSDKKKLLELFIQKEEVINLIKDHIFHKIENGTSHYDYKHTNDFGQTKSSFMKTDKMFSMQSFRKKTPSTGFTYTMQLNRTRTPSMNH